MVGKQASRTGQAVQCRRLDMRQLLRRALVLQIDPKIAIAQIIGENEHDIGRSCLLAGSVRITCRNLRGFGFCSSLIGTHGKTGRAQ